MAITPNVKSVQSTFNQRKFLLGAVSALTVGIVAGFGAKLLAGGSAGAYNSSAVNTGDTAWVLTAAALVMLMTPAVGFFYGGMVRSKNVVSVIKQSVVILAQTVRAARELWRRERIDGIKERVSEGGYAVSSKDLAQRVLATKV